MGSKMRITFVLPGGGLSGGVRVVAGYAHRLHLRGHKVVLVLRRRRRSLKERVGILLREQCWPAEWVTGPCHLHGLPFEQRVIDSSRPVVDGDLPDSDVVIATWWETAEWVSRLSPSKGAKVYFIQHDERTAYSEHLGHFWPRIARTWSLPLHKIVVARWLKELVEPYDPVGSTICVPNAVDLAQFHAPPRSKQPVPTVGLMYSTTRFKGADISIAAFREAARLIPSLRLVAFGADEPEAKLPLPLGTQYFCTPPQGSIPRIYAQCDAWLFGSRSEGFGLPILEAMACRTPVIGAPTGAAPELLASGGGILVHPEDPMGMADAIRRIAVMDSNEWEAMSRTAYATATGWNWDRATALFEGALDAAVRCSEPKLVG